jgi:Flp pilus assembly protein CpaB
MRVTLSKYRFRNAFIAGGLAIVGVLLVFAYVTSYRHDVQRGQDQVTVYVAARDIPEGTTGSDVAGSYLRKETVLKRNVVSGAISSPSQLSTYAAAQPILADEQVTTRQFHPANETGVLASISGNHRAMTVRGDSDMLLAGIVKDGDHVDVLANVRYIVRQPASTSVGGGGDLRRVATRVILRDIAVLQAPDSPSSSSVSGTANAVITLAPTDAQAQKLLFAIKNGDWWLVLRPVAKPDDSPESVETIESMLTDGLGQRGLIQLTGGEGKIGSAG